MTVKAGDIVHYRTVIAGLQGEGEVDVAAIVAFVDKEGNPYFVAFTDSDDYIRPVAGEVSGTWKVPAEA